MRNLTMLSLFAGSGGFELAGELNGIKTLANSEVEPFPIRVLEKNYPGVVQLGDVSAVKGAEIEPVDIVTFGSPCFVGNTLIKTEQGLIPIKEVKIGNTVHINGKSYKVTDSACTGIKKVISLYFADGQVVSCTPDHKFLSDDGWVEAKDIIIGLTTLVKDDNGRTFVTRVKEQANEQRVYDITVEGVHCFPLKNGIIAHNCQSLSVAGKRHGLKHADKGDESTTRSGLFFDALRIIEEMRNATNGKYPRYGVWENVAGAFSSSKGKDFHRVLEEFCQVKDPNIEIPLLAKWPRAGEIMGNDFSLAWRTLDAQYWGVPQRRKRIYLVCDFDGLTAPNIFRNEGAFRPKPTGPAYRAWIW